MGAAPAYSYQYERAFENESRTRVSVMPGQKAHVQPSVLSSNVVFLAKVVAAMLVVVASISFVRIGLASATASVSMQSQQLSAQIDDARSSGAVLEVSQSALSNPTKIKQQATSLDMVAPETVGVIEMDKDVVATDESGALSLSKSIAIAAGAEA